MKYHRILFAVVLLAVVAAAAQFAPAAFGQAADSSWTTLFNGTGLDGWNPIGDANWTLADGAVQADQGTGFLVSRAAYADFQLRVEFWVDDDANSGVFLRCGDPQEVTAMNAYEVNIYDKRPDPAYRTGAIVDVAQPLAQLNTGGKWNTYEITAQGSHLTVTLNGTRTVDATDAKHARGPIALQYGAGANGAGIVKFRKVEIRAL
jgi:3-keto-disaccharide hydrolase